jgi:alanine racemase
MDQMMIRIDSGDAEVGDEIVVMGAQGNAVRLRLLNRVTNNKKDKIF